MYRPGTPLKPTSIGSKLRRKTTEARHRKARGAEKVGHTPGADYARRIKSAFKRGK